MISESTDNFTTCLGVLGFATHQNLEQTSYDEICPAFLKRSKKVMRKRELALEAEESKDPKLMKVILQTVFVGMQSLISFLKRRCNSVMTVVKSHSVADETR